MAAASGDEEEQEVDVLGAIGGDDGGEESPFQMVHAGDELVFLVDSGSPSLLVARFGSETDAEEGSTFPLRCWL